MAERPRSPQDKKRLSLEREGRNVYGENDKASRKAIPRFKRESARGERRGVSRLLGALEGRSTAEADDLTDSIDPHLAETTFHGAHPEKTKVPDRPLGLHLNAKRVFDEGTSSDDLPMRNRREIIRKEMADRLGYGSNPRPWLRKAPKGGGA